VRRILCFIALLSLVLSGSAQGMRAPMVSMTQACMCGCGASSEGTCPCGMPQDSSGSSRPASSGCSSSSSQCNTHPPNTGAAASQSREETNPSPSIAKKEPAPWPTTLQAVRFQGLTELNSSDLNRWVNSAPPPEGTISRLSRISVFRI